MSINYDESLDENPFFKIIQEHHSDIIKKATEEDWIICIPRIGTIEPTTITPEDILEHILVPNLDLPNTHFCTLTKKSVTVCNKYLKLQDDEPINILFDETFYIEKFQKYKLWCIDRPFHRCLSNNESCINVRNVQDCIALLYTKYNNKLYCINKIIEEFSNNDCEFASLEVLKRQVTNVYKDCIEIIISNSQKTCNGNIRLSLETYIQHSIHHKLFLAICNATSQTDASFNKIHRNLYGIQLKDLEVKNEFFDSIASARRELSSINRFSTVLGKIECLRRTVNSFNQKNNKKLFLITTDDLIKIFTFLLIKCNLTNWLANLMYITHFRLSSLNLSDENSFLITTLEAAIEYVKSGELEKVICNYYEELNDNNLNKIVQCVKDGNLDLIKSFFNNNNKSFCVDKISECHPLCSCEKCESIIPYSINSCDDKGCTTLHLACIYGKAHVVEYLLSKNADVNIVDHSESTPLHYASLKGHQNAVLLLLHSKASVDVKDCDGNTALHLATNNGHENCIKALLYFVEQKSCFIDVNSKNNNGDTPLHLATKWGYSSIAHILLQYGADINRINKCNQRVWDIVHNSYLKKLLLSYTDKFNKNEQNILAINSNFEGKNETNNHLGVQLKNIEQIKKIDLALKSIENNDLPLMCYYLGIPTPNVVNSEPKGVCHPLCNCDHCIKQFENPTIPSSEASETVNINACNSEGYSALHIAAKCGRTDMLRLLLDSGALINVKTYKHHFTPLHLGCKYQRIQIVRELLTCGGCNLDAQDINGNSPLHFACLSNNTRIVELLLSRGCDSNIKNNEGKTCLQEATSKMLYNVITVLNSKYQNNEMPDNSSDLFPF